MTPQDRRAVHEANRQSWNAATVAHNSHKKNQAAFLRAGGTTLFPEEIELLGDVAGKRAVHLQCNAGQDTLSLARMGAAVVGVDISDAAVDFARELSQAAGIDAQFERADVYDWLDSAADGRRRFDIAFCSYGAICWLSDLQRWAHGVARVLAPRGHFVTVEFHPVSAMYNEKWQRVYPYFGGGEAEFDEIGISDYVARSASGLAPMGYEQGVSEFRNPHPSYCFNWGIGEVLTALLDAGLAIETFREFPFSNGARLFDGMREMTGRRMYPPDDMPNLPLMYGLAARRA